MECDIKIPTLKEMERFLVIAALHKTDFNQTKAAKMLGITKRSVFNKLQDILNNNETPQGVKEMVLDARGKTTKIATAHYQDQYHGLGDFIDHELLKMYYQFCKNYHHYIVTFEKLLKMSGPQRAKLLRADKDLREEYTRRTQVGENNAVHHA